MEEANLNNGYSNGTNTTALLNGTGPSTYIGTGSSGAKVWKAGVDLNLDKYGLGSRTLGVAYGSYDLKNNRNGNVDSDYNVWDVVYTCNGMLLKNLDAKLAYENTDNKVDNKDQSWFKFILNYNF